MLNIGGQTVRLATPGGTLLKAGSTLTGKKLMIFDFKTSYQSLKWKLFGHTEMIIATISVAIWQI